MHSSAQMAADRHLSRTSPWRILLPAALAWVFLGPGCRGPDEGDGDAGDPLADEVEPGDADADDHGEDATGDADSFDAAEDARTDGPDGPESPDAEPDGPDADDGIGEGPPFPSCPAGPRTVTLPSLPPSPSPPLLAYRSGIEIPDFEYPPGIPPVLNGTTIDRFMAGFPRGMRSERFADLDLDGDLDIVTAVTRTILNLGDGTFADISDPLLEPDVYEIDVGDIDGDGFPDLAVRHDASPYEPTPDFAAWYPGNGDGSFDAAGRVVDTVPTMLRLFDADLDGDADLLTGRLLLNDGTGVFADETARIEGWTAATRYHAVCVGDVTGDGRPDLLGCPDGCWGAPEHLWIATAGGFFEEHVVAAPSFGYGCRDLGDLDGDGTAEELLTPLPDFVTMWGWFNRCEALDGYGPSTIRRYSGGDFVDMLDEWYPRDMAYIWEPFGDVDGDGDLDLGRVVNTFFDGAAADAAPPAADVRWLTDGAVVGETPAFAVLLLDDVSGVDFDRMTILLNGTDATEAFWAAMGGRLEWETVFLAPWRPAPDLILAGENDLDVHGCDRAGNCAATQLRFTYDPGFPGISLRADAPDTVPRGEPVTFTVEAANSGTFFSFNDLPAPLDVSLSVTGADGSAVHAESIRFDLWCRHDLDDYGVCAAMQAFPVWNGLDASDAPAPPGTYTVEVRSEPPFEGSASSDTFEVL
jgi:hypothetical protein